MARLAGDSDYYTVAMLDRDGNPTGHQYAFPSVTTILTALEREGLRYFFFWETLSGVSTLIENGVQLPPDKKAIKKLLDQNQLGPMAVRDAAGARGHDLHKDLEDLCAQGALSASEPASANLVAWWEARNLTPEHIIASEEPVVSFKHRYAGTVDLIYRDPATGETVLSDLKTGKSIYRTNFIQVAAYKAAWEEQGGEPIDRVTILHVRDEGWKELCDNGVPPVSFDDFLAIQDVWNRIPEKWVAKDVSIP